MTSVVTTKLEKRVPGIPVEMEDSVVRTEPTEVGDKTCLLSVAVLDCNSTVDVVSP